MLNMKLSPSRTEMEQAFYSKDADYDGVFFVGVQTTGIFCRPSCPSRPQPENIEFFSTLREAIAAGYRPCKRCHPTEAYGTPPAWVTALIQQVEAAPHAKITAAELQLLGISPEQARRWFRDHYGMTFSEWCRSQRLANAFTHIRNGASLDDVVLSNGYESYSGFREAFGKTFGMPPGQEQTGDFVAVQQLETPLGVLLVGAVREGICLVEYSDRRMLEQNYATLRQQFGYPVLPVAHPHIDHLRQELSQYFAGTLTQFTVPVVIRGTAFQEKVWLALQQIPYGKTIAYDQLAQNIGQPTAMRAVARANSMNRISILIPCHRVIGKDGQLTGYGGGLWRKRLLLELERTGRLPGDDRN
jgi:AraC family transcriptional regulator, regulatory protein of adaptative response / methylated-DNA-[protein]-cysteine methyltransferase